MRRTLSGFAVYLLIALSLAGTVYAQSTTQAPAYTNFLQSTVLSVYSDGTAEVNQTATVPQNMTAITLPLLSSQVGNVLALGQNRSLLSYQLTAQNITIYTLGARGVALSYETNALTTKQGTLWTVQFASPFDMTLVLPTQATTLYLSGAPVSVSTKDNRPMFVLKSGTWEISYGLPIAVPQTPGSTTSTTTTSAGTSNASQQGALLTQLSIVGIIVVALAVVGGVAIVARGKRRGIADVGDLRFGDAEMLNFIKEKGGRVIEAEIREHFGLPRTSAWRQAKRLEKLGYVRISKMGMQNQVELLRQDFEQAPHL